MSGSARWASGARSPDAPTLPCSGTTGWMPAAEEARAGGPRGAAGSRCGRARACSPGAGASPGRPRAGTAGPTPGRVAHQEVLLEPAGLGGRDRGRRQVAEPGRHAVHDGALGDERLDDVARLLHPLAGVDVERGVGAVRGRRPRRRRRSGRRRSGRSGRRRGRPAWPARGPGRSAGPPAHSPCRG